MRRNPQRPAKPIAQPLVVAIGASAGGPVALHKILSELPGDFPVPLVIVQHMADGLLLINDQGIIVTCNPALAMMLGINSGQIVGQKVGSPNLHPNLSGITGMTTEYARTGVLAKEVAIESPRRRSLQVFSTLIIDDIGYVQQSREEMEVLFTFLAERDERRSVVITSNLVFSQWDQIFKDPMTTAAAIDRVVHHSIIVEFGKEMSSHRADEAALHHQELS